MEAIVASIIAFISNNTAVVSVVGTILTNQVIKMLPIKPNGILELIGEVMVKIGNTLIVNSSVPGAPAAVTAAAALKSPSQPLAPLQK